jgi:hypothetical protein
MDPGQLLWILGSYIGSWVICKYGLSKVLRSQWIGLGCVCKLWLLYCRSWATNIEVDIYCIDPGLEAQRLICSSWAANTEVNM